MVKVKEQRRVIKSEGWVSITLTPKEYIRFKSSRLRPFSKDKILFITLTLESARELKSQLPK